MSLDDINYEGKRLDDKEFKIKFKTGEDIDNARNNAIAGEMFIATGNNAGLYFATQTSDKGNDFIYKAGDLSAENKIRVKTPFITYKITSTGGDFTLRSTGTVNYDVDWGDGSSESSTSNDLAHTYAAGSYTIKITNRGQIYAPDFADSVQNIIHTSDSLQITSVEIGDGVNLGTALGSSWRGATNMTDFTALGATSTVTNFYETWRQTGLTSFPLIDTSAGTEFSSAWIYCSGLTSFPLIDTSNGSAFNRAWQATGLTSFPSLDFSNATTFNNSWRAASSLSDFPANMFDTTGTLVSNAFEDAWKFCALTAQSIENILVSLDTNGASNITLGISDGTNAAYSTWSTAAQTALSNLQNKGWTVSYNT